MTASVLEWLTLPNGDSIVASPERAWRRPAAFLPGDPFASPMTGAGSPASTRMLLEAVVGAAFHECSAASSEAPLTVERYVWRLVEYYQASHFTAIVLQAAHESFGRSGRSDLAEYVREKAREETGHDMLAFADLVDLGFDAEGLVAACHPSRAAALIAHLRATVEADPIAILGCEYAMERTGVAVQPAYVEAVRARLPRDATRCLRVHSATGPEAVHVEEAAARIASLPAADRIRIATACYETVGVIFGPRARECPSDAELERLLGPFRRTKIHPAHAEE